MTSTANHIILSTGNILNTDKKAGRKSTEELLDSLNATAINGELGNQTLGEIKLNEYERKEISIAAKVFLNNQSVENLDEAITSLLSTLNIDYVDNTVLSYHPQPKVIAEETSDYATNGTNSENFGILKWGSKCANAVQTLKQLWAKLEEYTNSKKIMQIGVSDLDTETLTDLYESANIPPTITQINLSSCCVVPPSLQEFCNQKEIQLLTHSDPEVILDTSALAKIGINNIEPLWTVRYQIHVKCRGLLYAKGYIVGATNKNIPK